MLIVTYDPLDGQAIADGMVELFTTNIMMLAARLPYQKIEHTISTWHVIDRLRLAIIKEELPLDTFKLIFEGEEIVLNEYGNPKEWPKGIDVTDAIVSNVLTAQLLKRKRNLEQATGTTIVRNHNE